MGFCSPRSFSPASIYKMEGIGALFSAFLTTSFVSLIDIIKVF